jgi:hypothetical protein
MDQYCAVIFNANLPHQVLGKSMQRCRWRYRVTHRLTGVIKKKLVNFFLLHKRIPKLCSNKALFALERLPS